MRSSSPPLLSPTLAAELSSLLRPSAPAASCAPGSAYESPSSPRQPPPGLEPLLVRGRHFAASLHSHSEWELGLLQQGAVTTEADSQLHSHAAHTHGVLFLVPPGVPHAASSDPRHLPPLLRSVRLTPTLLERTLEGACRRSVSLPTHVTTLWHERAALLFERFHRSLCEGAAPLEWETWLVEALVDLVVHGCAGGVLSPVRSERRAVRRARDYLHARATERVSLEELSRVAGLSKYHLARAFSREVGLPPHAYQHRLRLWRALPLLRQGLPAVEVAQELGFADQAHFARAFKACHGLTPRSYVRRP